MMLFGCSYDRNRDFEVLMVCFGIGLLFLLRLQFICDITYESWDDCLLF